MLKKGLIFFVAVMLFGFVAKAQVYDFLTIGPQIPLGKFKDSYKVGIGMNNALQIPFGKGFAAGINLGLSRFKWDVVDGNTLIVPITGLFEYHLGSSHSPYFGIDLGGYYSYTKLNINGADGKTSKFNFGFSPTIGYTFDPFFINVKYHYMKSDNEATTWLSINLGWILNLQGW